MIQFEAKPERMWFSVFDPVDGVFKDPTYGRDDWIEQAQLDHGGWTVYDVTDPRAIMPVPTEATDD